MQEKIMSLSKKDFDVQYFRAGGKGGQKQNKTDSACRIIHRASGAVGECREERHQHQNKKIAFRRLTESRKFTLWLKMEIGARITGYQSMEEKIDEMLAPENLRIELL
jgi:protein subunit release factor B